MAQVTLKNDTILGPLDNELSTFAKGPGQNDGEKVDLTAARAVRDFCYLLFITVRDERGQKPHFQYRPDQKAADRLIRAAKRAEGKATFDLDEADYDWVTKKYEEWGYQVHGANAVAIREALEKPEKEKKDAAAAS